MTRNHQHFPLWAWGVIGAVTFLAISLLVVAVVLGVRAGQQQMDLQRHQEVGIALQQATDFRAEGNLEAALDAYQRVLVLDPGNKTATEGIAALLQMAAARTPNPAAPTNPIATPTAQDAVADSATPVAAATATLASAANVATTKPDFSGLLRAAQTDFDAGRWQEALNQLLSIHQKDPTYAKDKLDLMLFKAYVNLANEKDNDDKLEEALKLYNQALALHDDAPTSRERDLITQYLDAQTYEGVDWPLAVKTLKALYAEEPDYRDVADRLHQALIAYGEDLVAQNEHCQAVEQFTAAIAMQVIPGLIDKRDQAQTQCATGKNAANGAVISGTLTVATPTGEVTPATTAETTETTETPTPAAVQAETGEKPTIGRILYSAHDINTGHSRIMLQPVAGGAATLFREDAAQPALRPDGQRLIYRNVRTDMGGLSAWDPGTGMLLRFTEYPEDTFPTWNGQGNQLAFASNREGDRRWRVYVMWAEANSAPTKLDFGQAPAWNPVADQIAFKGCDASGNRCGLWTINSSGSGQAPLTTVQADDQPAWSPDGRFVVFMSTGRDGNPEIYRIDVSTSQVVRLTDNSTIDGLPSVSPDGQWVAFVSNRDGAWKLWAVPLAGGTAVAIAPMSGDLGNWLEQDIQWVN